MIPEFPKFKKLELSDRVDVEAITGRYLPFSDFQFTSMWSWDVKGSTRISTSRGNLVIRFSHYLTGTPFYSFIGSNDLDNVAENLLRLSGEEGIEQRLFLVPETSVSGLDRNRFKVDEDRDNFDYIVSTNKMKPPDQKKKLSTRRKLANKLKSLEHLSISPINLRDEAVCAQIYEVSVAWEMQRGVDVLSANYLSMALQRCLALGSQNNSLNIGIFYDGRLIGYTLNEIVGRGYALGNFQQADTHFSGGVYTLLMHETSVYMEQLGCDKMNLEQDLGIDGLRNWKMSYGNPNFLKKYVVSRLIA